jgi:hypothetical protein
MNSNSVSRRQFLRATAIGGVVSTAPILTQDATAAVSSHHGRAKPLAQEYTIATKVPEKGFFVHDPAMTVLPNGKFVVASPIWRRPARPSERNKYIAVSVSEDKGRTWTKVCEKPWAEAALYVIEKRLYMFTQLATWEGVWVTASDDDGKTWLDPVEVIKGAPGRQHWNLQVNIVIKDGWLYWGNGKAYQAMGAVACNLRKGILNPDAWRASEVVEMPIPVEVTSGQFKDGSTMRCLEGNVVVVGGNLLVIARAVINRYGTANMAAVFDLKNEDDKLNLTFRQLYPLPGGQCKFYILWDEPSQMFWMASNYPTNSQDLIHAARRFPNAYQTGARSLREDRRIMMLSYSLDSLNWFTAGCIAMAEKMNQSFMYPSMVIDGDDIAVLSRTGRDSGDYHDADLATFHRVRNFRSLALDIFPKL